MIKKIKKAFAGVLAGVLAFSCLVSAGPKADVKAAEDGYEVFVAMGGDKDAKDDWGWGYAGKDVEGVTATKAKIKEGETVTVGLEFSKEVIATWWIAPVMLSNDVTQAEFDVKVLIDGKEIACDITKGDNWWREDTGEYKKDEAIRIAGGYNEWGTQYIDKPVNYKKIEFQITAKKLSTEAVEEGTDSTEEYPLYVALGGDKDAEGDWGWGYEGKDADGITATTGKIKVGQTVKVGLEFASEVKHCYYTCPFIVGEKIVNAEFDVKCYVDGKEVACDLTKGDNWWYEATGGFSKDQAVRIAGGCNEWATCYIEQPANFKKIEFEVTAKSIKIGSEEKKPQSAAGDVDLKGKYNAFLGFQTPKYSFRNEYDEKNYGHENSEFFNRVTGWDADNNALVLDGKFTDTVIEGNGTYTVSVSGLNFPEGEFDSQQNMNLLFLSTDIPNTGAITISDMKLSVDGTNVDIKPILSEDSVDYLLMSIQNIYSDDENVKSIGYYPTPMKEITITFTVSGFDYDKASGDEGKEETPKGDENKDDATSTPAPTDAPKADEKNDGLSTGAIIAIIAGAVVVIGGAVAVIVKKKKK